MNHLQTEIRRDSEENLSTSLFSEIETKLKERANEVVSLKQALLSQNEKLQLIEKQKSVLIELENTIREQNQDLVIQLQKVSEENERKTRMLAIEAPLKTKIIIEHEELRKKFFLSETKLRNALEKEASLVESLAKSRSEIASNLKEMRNLKESLIQVEHEKQELKTALLHAKKLNEEVLGQINQYEALSTEKVKKEVQAVQEKYQSQFATLKGELDQLKLENKMKAESIAKTKQIQQARQERLKTYAERVNQEKTTLASFTEGLKQEMTLAAKMNPVKDLLKLTEFELGKLEIELMKTPTSSPIRRNLEAGVDELVQQKRFLSGVLSDSENEWNQKIQKLIELSRDFRLETLPPLPPIEVGNDG